MFKCDVCGIEVDRNSKIDFLNIHLHLCTMCRNETLDHLVQQRIKYRGGMMKK